MKKTITILITIWLVVVLAACSVSSPTVTTSSTNTTNTSSSTTTSSAAGSTSSTVAATESSATSASGGESASAALAENSQTHAGADDYTWDASAVTALTLNGDSISVEGSGVNVAGSVATITAAGTYSLSGSLTDGQIVVDTGDEALVRLILNGVTLSNSTGAPLNIANAEEVLIVLADGTQNTITDSANYVFPSAEEDEPNAALFSKADLTIYGAGTLIVNGNYNDGIASKDGLVIASGTLIVTAVDDGIRGKDYLVIETGNITVTAGGDGLKADNDEDAALGYLAVQGGSVTVTAGGDALTAQTDVIINAGEFNLTTGAGSSAYVDESTSAKGIKGLVSVNIAGGTFTINSADDAVHSNDHIEINGGVFNLSSGDDGMHADATLVINGGEIMVSESFEGLESAVITINAGTIHVYASDDGINVAGGNDGSGTAAGMGGGRGGPGQDMFAASGDYYLYINGGYIFVDAAGDGLDANGAIVMTGGVVLVNGPTEQMNGALDYDRGFQITGGLLVTTGSAGMLQAPDTTSSQNSVAMAFNGTLPAGTLINIQNSAGEDLLTYGSTKPYQALVFSSPDLHAGETYTVNYDGSSTGSVSDGLYTGGEYSAGAQLTTFSVSSVVTMLGGRSR